jgi:hypothetical protein
MRTTEIPRLRPRNVCDDQRSSHATPDMRLRNPEYALQQPSTARQKRGDSDEVEKGWKAVEGLHGMRRYWENTMEDWETSGKSHFCIFVMIRME